MGWVAVGIGKINGNKHLGDVIVFYQISDSDEWTAVDGYALDGTIYKDTDTTLDANA